MSQYLRSQSSRSTPQSEPIPGSSQKQNEAGGFAWPVDDWMRARRFLILGAEDGTYYASQGRLVRENAAAFERCIVEDGLRAVELIRDVSSRGLAKSNDPALFALALATAAKDVETRKEAWRSLTTVARTGTHLLHFVAFREQFGGWGRSARVGVGHWFTDKEPDRLAYQLIKYRQRDDWTQRDVMRLAHPKLPATKIAHATLYDFACGREIPSLLPDELRLLEGYRMAQKAEKASQSATIIREYGLPREAVNTDHLKAPEVWEALLETMPITAMIRNLATMTRVGVLKPLSDNAKLIAERLTDAERLSKGRVHPISILSALRIYGRGYSELGRGEPWEPVGEVIDALDAAFYKAFEFIEPAQKKTLVALDVSGSMGSPIAGIAGLTARDGAAAMAMATVKTEPSYHSVAFTSGGQRGWRGSAVEQFPMSKNERLDDVIRHMNSMSFGGTDCALPMLYALEAGLEVETFAIYTDNETWAGTPHPAQALVQYRQKTGINARLVVVGMTSGGFSIADPDDAGMMDVVGFDASAPATMAAFSRGEV